MVEKSPNFVEVDASSGFSPIHFATFSGQVDVVELLLRKGCKITTTTTKQRWTPFHIAAYYGYLEILKVHQIFSFLFIYLVFVA